MKPEKVFLQISNQRAMTMLLMVWLQTGALLLPGVGLAHASDTAEDNCAEASQVTRIAPGVFVRHGTIALPSPANGGAIANIGFIIGDQSVAVIDTGGSLCDGLALRRAIRQQTDLPVKYVVNTHVHPDHVFGNAAFAEDGAIFIGHSNLPRALAERGSYYLESYIRQVGAAKMEGTRIISPDKRVQDRLLIDLGGRELEVRAYPSAHTDNDLTVFDKKSGILWTGDLVFLNHIPVLDGRLTGWLAVTSELMKHEARRIVPGHGPIVAPWPEAGKNQHRYLARLAKDLRKAIAAGTGIRQTADNAVESEKGKWRLFDSYNRRNATTAYAELEWE